jgi:V/A-type H+-transporting ATPase subunit A
MPGAFGSGKTVLLRQIARHTDADIVVYVGCGARGSEMSEFFAELQRLSDNRTALIANTADMPPAEREAAIYTGAAIAEYYRDTGHDVLLIIDSISRWADGLREISIKRGEVSGDNGYPANLASRVMRLFERAGRVESLGGGQSGSLSIVGALSPPGDDIFDPVTQAAMRAVKVLWDMDVSLARARKFPAINEQTSYSLYYDARTAETDPHRAAVPLPAPRAGTAKHGAKEAAEDE